MDYFIEFESLKKEIGALKKEIGALAETADRIAAAYAVAEDFTRTFLAECKKQGIDVVSIGKKTKLIRETMTFPFSLDGSVFADKETDGWPTIWKVCDAFNIRGCGNHNQHFIDDKHRALLVDGVYILKNGVWYRE